MITGRARFDARDGAGNVVALEGTINIDEAPTGSVAFDRASIAQIGGEAVVTVTTFDPEGGPVEILNATFSHGTVENIGPGTYRVRVA